MKYASEVIELLAAYPGREFRMLHIVRYVANGQPNCARERDRLRKGVKRVLESLVESGQVWMKHADKKGASAKYQWKVGHADFENWDNKCDNMSRELTP